MVESFDHPETAEVRIEFGAAVMPPIWFQSVDEASLIQVQPYRFAYNWRRVSPDNDYPFFDDVRAHFFKHLDLFLSSVSGGSIEALAPDWCEVTYVNHVVTDATRARG